MIEIQNLSANASVKDQGVTSLSRRLVQIEDILKNNKP